MNNAKRITGALLATAAAGMFSIAATPAVQAAEGEVMCAGVNACKGHGACKSATNACKGQNGCKGKGVVAMSEQACKDIGGTYTPQAFLDKKS
ncbi:MAG: BufA2 family periplasmic bufferin-type metallophore [Burkholderiales bacterium]